MNNVLAYAAVLQETGSTSEVAGTALNRFFSTLTTRTKEAYEIARKANPALTIQEFTHLVNTDFNQAIQVFLAGLREGVKSTTDQAQLLATLKLQSGEAKNAIITLSQNTDLFAERQRTANNQLREATSLSQEAAVNTEMLAGSWDKLTNDVKNFFTSGAAGSALKWLVDATRTLYSSTVGDSFRAIGNGLDYVKEKAGPAEKPLKNYSETIVNSTLATRKHAGANQELLDSYIKLQNIPQRTAAREAELAQTRLRVLQTFGADSTAVVQASIDKQTELVGSVTRGLERDLADMDTVITRTSQRVAAAQQAAFVQSTALTSAQIEQAKQIAKARLDDADYKPGKSTVPELERTIAANMRLLKAERDLAEQQRNRANLAAGLAKLEGQNTQAKKDGADTADAEADAEVDLGRTRRENAKNRIAELQDALADNQKQIEAIREYQAEQNKLFADGQLSADVFRDAVAGTEDAITQKQRAALAIRKQLARAEAFEALEEAKKSEMQQLKAKDLSLKEQLDIQGQYASASVEIIRKRDREIAKAEKDCLNYLKVKQLEFKLL